MYVSTPVNDGELRVYRCDAKECGKLIVYPMIRKSGVCPRCKGRRVRGTAYIRWWEYPQLWPYMLTPLLCRIGLQSLCEKRNWL